MNNLIAATPSELMQQINNLFMYQNGVSLEAMLEPISDAYPAGASIRDSDTYQQIMEARTEDDDSIPRGVWEVDLQQADWETVYKESLHAIQNKSKDIQLGAWLLEAQMMRTGFTAIAPGIGLLQQLLSRYWEEAYPKIHGEDNEHRVNVLSWLNSKLSILAKQIPITSESTVQQSYSWADWEMALRYAQLNNASTRQELDDVELELDTVINAIKQTPIDFYRDLYLDLELALSAIDNFLTFLDDKLAHDSPSLSTITGVLEQVAELAHQQLEERGAIHTIEPLTSDQAAPSSAPTPPLKLRQDNSEVFSIPKTRSEAYAALTVIANFLALDEPHSPTPYLLFKAVDWGQMNTRDLYQELFVVQQGQLNIFELLGIDASDRSKAAAATE